MKNKQNQLQNPQFQRPNIGAPIGFYPSPEQMMMMNRPMPLLQPNQNINPNMNPNINPNMVPPPNMNFGMHNQYNPNMGMNRGMPPKNNPPPRTN